MATRIDEPAARTAPPNPPPALLVQLRDAWARPTTRLTLMGAAVGTALLGLVYRENIEHMFVSWSTDGNYSHGFLVPFISLYFANLAAERGPIRIRGGAALGSALLAVALFLKLATKIVVAGTIGDVSMLIAIAGIVALLAGTDALRRYWFAIAFLAFMIPLPVQLYALIASPLQLWVSRVASVLLNATGVPVLTEGNMMTLPGNVQMFVAEACSGMRQLTGFLALTAAVAYLAPRPLWYRGVIMLASLPIAMTANVARVTLTGYIMYYVNPHYASGAYHTIEGLLLLGFGLSLLRALGAVMDLAIDMFRRPEPATPQRLARGPAAPAEAPEPAAVGD